MKIKLLLPVLFFSVINVSAQKTYLTAGVGYGFFLPPITNSSSMPYTTSNHINTLGRGMNYGFNIGYMATEHAGVDLGIWYVAGSTFKSFAMDSIRSEVPVRFRGNTLRIMPALKLSWGTKHKPYAKLGFLLGIASEAEYEAIYSVNNIGASSEYIITHKFSGGSSMGWTGAVGINFSGEEKISFFIEASMCSQLYEPVMETKEEPGAAPVTFNLVDDPNPNNPYEKQKPSFPFGSFGINAGVKFLLGEKKFTGPSPNYSW